MTLQDFIALAKTFNKEYSGFDEIFKDWALKAKGKSIADRDIEYDKQDNFLWTSFNTGGTSGGSCWDDSDPQDWYTSESKPDFISLENFLEKVAPTLPFKKFLEIKNSLVKEFCYTHYEYYGNCDSYDVDYVYLPDLYKFLKKADLL